MAKKEKIPKKQQVAGVPCYWQLLGVEGKIIKFNYLTGETLLLKEDKWVKVIEG